MCWWGNIYRSTIDCETRVLLWKGNPGNDAPPLLSGVVGHPYVIQSERYQHDSLSRTLVGIVGVDTHIHTHTSLLHKHTHTHTLSHVHTHMHIHTDTRTWSLQVSWVGTLSHYWFWVCAALLIWDTQTGWVNTHTHAHTRTHICVHTHTFSFTYFATCWW